MNRSLEIIKELYKPMKIEKKNKVYILDTMEGKLVCKEMNVPLIYKKYNYLKSRGFSYYIPLSENSKDDLGIFPYMEDIYMPNDEKARDLIKTLALLHCKTMYEKEVTLDTYKKIYEDILSKYLGIMDLLERYFRDFLEEKYTLPSHYLFLRNYSIFYGCILRGRKLLDKWYDKVKSKNKIRMCFIHNHVSLEHFIQNEESYLINFSYATYDTPVLDLYHFFLEDYDKISFSSLLPIYLDICNLHEDEELLLCSLVLIPIVKKLDNKEYENCQNIRKCITYLMRAMEVEEYFNKAKEV